MKNLSVMIIFILTNEVIEVILEVNRGWCGPLIKCADMFERVLKCYRHP